MAKVDPSLEPLPPPSGRNAAIFKPLRCYITFARLFGGFPMHYSHFDDDEDEHFRFTRSSFFSITLVFVAAVAIYLAQVMISHANGLFGWTNMQEMKLQGLTTTDTVAIFGLWVPHIFSFFAHFRILKKSGELFSNVSSRMRDMPHIRISEGEINSCFKWIPVKTAMTTIMGVFVCILSGLVDGLAIQSRLQSQIYFYATVVLKFLLTSIILLSPTSTVSYMITNHTLAITGLIVKKYELQVQLLAEGGKYQQRDLLWSKHFIDTGIYVSDLVELSELAVGPLIFTSLAVSFTTEVFGVFFGIVMFTSFSDDGFNLLMFLFGLFFAILGCLALFSHLVIMFKGQAITDSVKSSVKALETIVFKQELELSEVDMTKLGLLFKRWSRPAAIRPLDTMDVNRTTGLSIYGLLITYIIVLLQFKVEEYKFEKEP